MQDKRIVNWDRLDALIWEQGLSPSGAAVAIGISTGTMQKIKKGQPVVARPVKMIADFFDVKVSYLLGG